MHGHGARPVFRCGTAKAAFRMFSFDDLAVGRERTVGLSLASFHHVTGADQVGPVVCPDPCSQ